MIGTTDTNFNAGADTLIVGTGSGDCGITIYTGSSAGHKGSIFFGDTAAGDAANSQKGQISYEQNNEIMTFLTNNTLTMQMDLNGHVTMPRQPVFSCVLGAGNQGSLAVGTLHTVLFTELFDTGNNFASNAFTAPVTGKYQLQSNLYINNMDDATAFFQLILVTSNRSYYAIIDPRAFDQDPGQCSLQIAVLADMDASDTAIVKLQLGSGGSAQSSIYSLSNFSGYLVA